MLSIAIDGPSGAGKSTIAKTVAEKLGITYIDTGAMYRAVALEMTDSGIDVNDAKSVIHTLDGISIKLEHIDGTQHIFLNGKDVSARIREHAVSKAASDVSKIPEVRLKLVEMQRKIAEEKDVIMDGRDIGSYVLPNATYKFYLTASAEIRARRRFKELTEKGQTVEYDKIYRDICDRDYNDMNRSFAPLVKTDDAILVDSSDLTVEEVTQTILGKIKK